MKVGLLYQGDDVRWIWGSAVTTLHLAAALRAEGHEVWRASVTDRSDWSDVPLAATDLLISEGVPRGLIAGPVWDACRVRVFWWLSELYHGVESLAESGFDAVACNSREGTRQLDALRVPASFIELAAPRSFADAKAKPEYRSFAVYLGNHPHKSDAQLALLFPAAARHGLALWGSGWDRSPYAAHHRGVLGLEEIAPLYRSVDVVLALTEARQKKWGMINNRIFEALAAGAVVVSDPFPLLADHPLGAFVRFVESAGEAEEVMAHLANDKTAAQAHAVEGRRLVMAEHHYGVRARAFGELHDRCRG